MTSKYFPETMKVGGIFSSNPDQTPMHNANKAFLAYCTSDGHMGGTGGPDKAD